MIQIPLWLVAVIAASAIAGVAVGRWTSASRMDGVRQPEAPAAPGTAVPAAFVNGINVNLRSGPGLSYPVVARLQDGEGLILAGERAGWCSVSTMTGASGYVFGAFVRGAPWVDRGAGRIVRSLVSDGSPSVVLRSGDKVFVSRLSDGSFIVTLPTGRQWRVSPNDVDLLD